VQCCDSVQPAGSPAASSALKTLVNIVIPDANVPVGLQCNPISIIGAGSGGNWCVSSFLGIVCDERLMFLLVLQRVDACMLQQQLSGRVGQCRLRALHGAALSCLHLFYLSFSVRFPFFPRASVCPPLFTQHYRIYPQIFPC
jgi:hypothetical protein